MSPQEVDALLRLLAYNWESEERDFNEQDAAGRDGHIFKDMLILQEFTEAQPIW